MHAVQRFPENGKVLPQVLGIMERPHAVLAHHGRNTQHSQQHDPDNTPHGRTRIAKVGPTALMHSGHDAPAVPFRDKPNVRWSHSTWALSLEKDKAPLRNRNGALLQLVHVQAFTAVLGAAERIS